MNTKIIGFGHKLPGRIITNRDIAEQVNTTEDFIVSRTGVKCRRHVDITESVSSLMVPACEEAIRVAGVSAADIDLLIVNTLSEDHHDPSQACLIQPMLGLENCPAFDIKAQCSGLLYGISIARQFISNGTYNKVLVCCGEVLSKRMDAADEGRNLSILLGDGAGAMLLSSSPGEAGVIDIVLHADGSFFKLLWTASPGSAGSTFAGDKDACHYFRMQGKAMFRHAVEKLTEVCIEILEKNGLNLSDVDIVIPHQPNLRILEAVRTNLGIPSHKMLINIERYGNMASASLPVTLSEYMQSEKSLKNKLCLCIAYGSGATWGAMLYRF